MTPLPPPRLPRRAFTLVEMLIVVTIMIMLVAVTLPVAKKTMEGQHGREASRQLHAFFNMAKARALQTGRPCGVYFLFPDPPLGGPANPTTTTWTPAQYASYWPVRHVTQVHLAEVPPPYAGSTTGATGKVTNGFFIPCPPNSNILDPTELAYIQALLSPNEQFLVRFNYKGDWYRFNNTGDTSNGFPIAPVQVSPVQPYGAANAGAIGVSFQILRSPRPVGNPMDLPKGTCIDMTYSGAGNNSRQFPSSPTGIARNLAVMLAPNGGVDSMYVNGYPTADPIGSLYFLIGKVEKVPVTVATTYPHAPTDYASANPDPIRQTVSNLADPNSLWVVVGRSNGQVTTAENMPSPAAAANLATYIFAARQAAILGEQMGGQ